MPAPIQVLEIGSGEAVSETWGSNLLPDTGLVAVLNTSGSPIVPSDALVVVEVMDPVGQFVEIAEMAGGGQRERAVFWLGTSMGTFRFRRVRGHVGVFIPRWNPPPAEEPEED